MAKDFLNLIERALILGISDKINSLTGSSQNVYVYGQYPETEELKFPAVIIEQIGSGLEEKMVGEKVTFGNSSYSGEMYGVAYSINILIDKEASFNIGTSPQGTTNAKYKQRRLLNWMMLNIANTINSIDWATAVSSSPAGLSYNPRYDGSVEVLESHLRAWRDVGYLPAFQWYGATAQFSLVFKNYR